MRSKYVRHMYTYTHSESKQTDTHGERTCISSLKAESLFIYPAACSYVYPLICGRVGRVLNSMSVLVLCNTRFFGVVEYEMCV